MGVLQGEKEKISSSVFIGLVWGESGARRGTMCRAWAEVGEGLGV